MKTLKHYFLLLICLILFLSCSKHRNVTKSLFGLSNEYICKENMQKFENNIKSGKYFEWVDDKEDFYLNEKYYEDYDILLQFHKSSSYHTECNKDSSQWNEWMYYRHNGTEKEKEKWITACPFCLYLDDCLQKDSSFSANKDFEFKDSKLDFYQNLLIPEYQKRKAAKLEELEKKRIPEEWKDCRLIGFNYSASAAMYGYYIPSSFKNKKASSVFDRRNTLNKQKGDATYGIQTNVNINKSEKTATFDYECYAVSDHSDSYGQSKKIGDLSFTIKFSPEKNTAIIYNAKITTASSGKSQTFSYGVFDAEEMANAVDSFLEWVIDVDKI